MQEYPIKRGLTKDLEQRIAAELKNCFGVEPQKTGNTYRIRFGALKKLEATAGAGGKTLRVDTDSDTSAAMRRSSTPTSGSGNSWMRQRVSPRRNG